MNPELNIGGNSMSTTYAIFRKGLVPPENPEDGWWPDGLEEGEDYVEIGATACFRSYIGALLDYLPDDTPVYALDNGTQIKTLGELRKYYET